MEKQSAAYQTKTEAWRDECNQHGSTATLDLDDNAYRKSIAKSANIAVQVLQTSN